MNHDSIEFHNIAELNRGKNFQGLRLQRVPEKVREQLDEGTAGVMLSPASGELRFRMDDSLEKTTVTLSALEPTQLYVYYGPFQGQSYILDDKPKDITIKPHKRIIQLTDEQCREYPFNPNLVRLCFGGDYPEQVMYHGHGEGVSLPHKGDTPDKRYIAYGSSITHGTNNSGAALSYPAHTAWLLGYDMRNLGASGCCLCEPALADYLAEQSCDLMTLELSVNMLGRGFSAEEFKERAHYLVKRVALANPKRLVACISIFPFYYDLGEAFKVEGVKATPEEYRQVLRDIVTNLNLPHVILLEGPELLRDFSGLSHDLIHPGVRGMIQIGEELSKRIEKAIRHLNS